MRIADASAIERLISDRTEEGPSLEFKQALPDRSDKGKAEFLKDVVAFANSEGGTILYGLSEKAGVADALLSFSEVDFDEERRRLLQMADSQIEPRIFGLALDWVDCGSGRIAVLSIPKSMSQPHRFHHNGRSKFVVRNHTHVSEMSYDQIRDAFSLRSSLITRLELQWSEWLNLARNEGIFRPLVSHAGLHIGLMPASSVNGVQSLDLEAIYEPSTSLMNGRRWGGCSKDFNYEGLAIYQGRSEPRLNHLMQISRYGSIFGFEVIGDEWQDRLIIPSVRATHVLVETCEAMCTFANKWMNPDEWFLFGSLINLDDYKFIWRNGWHDEEKSFPRDTLAFPRLTLRSLVPEEGFPQMLRPWLDLLWQTHGMSKCTLIDDEGRLTD